MFLELGNDGFVLFDIGPVRMEVDDRRFWFIELSVTWLVREQDGVQLDPIVAAHVDEARHCLANS